MPEGFPEHREIVAIRFKPNDVLDTDPLGIAPLKPVGNAQRATLALAPAAQEALNGMFPSGTRAWITKLPPWPCLMMYGSAPRIGSGVADQKVPESSSRK